MVLYMKVQLIESREFDYIIKTLSNENHNSSFWCNLHYILEHYKNNELYTIYLEDEYEEKYNKIPYHYSEFYDKDIENINLTKAKKDNLLKMINNVHHNTNKDGYNLLDENTELYNDEYIEYLAEEYGIHYIDKNTIYQKLHQAEWNRKEKISVCNIKDFIPCFITKNKNNECDFLWVEKDFRHYGFATFLVKELKIEKVNNPLQSALPFWRKLGL